MSQAYQDFPAPTAQDLLRELYSLLAPPDPVCLAYLASLGLKSDPTFRSFNPLAGVDRPSFDAHTLLVWPVYAAGGAVAGLCGRWLTAKAVPVRAPLWVFGWPKGAAMRFGRCDDSRVVAVATDPETAIRARKVLAMPALAVAHWSQLGHLQPDHERVVLLDSWHGAEAGEELANLHDWLERRGQDVDIMPALELVQ